MGLFSIFKKNQEDGSMSSHLRGVLETVDELYMEAHATKSTKQLQAYLSRDCLVKVSQSVYSIGTRYFAAPKFRNTKWTILENVDDVLKIEKDVVFDKVLVGGKVSVAVANSYREIWTVDTSKRNVVITDISLIRSV